MLLTKGPKEMEQLLDGFIKAIKANDLLVYNVQVYKDGQELDRWSRFKKSDNGMSAFDAFSRFESYSTAKSFSSIGVGIAIDEGLISLDEKVANSFPELTYNINDSNILDTTVEHLLTMTTGLKEAIFFRDSKERANEKDWLQYIYQNAKYDKKPGEKFLYTNANTYLLGCLVEKKAGVNLFEYMRYRLFEPLGIKNPNMTACPLGHTIAANGLDINIDEMSRFGQMLLNKGIFDNKRIISEQYLSNALAPKVKTDVKKFWSSKNDTFDYGYQFWVDSANNCSFMLGILGQMTIVLSDKNAVVSIQSLEQNDAFLARLLWEYVVQNI